jgi:catechol 2,3-dioxygenase
VVVGRLASVAFGIGEGALDRTQAFYRDLLGVTEVGRHDGLVFLSGGMTADYDVLLGPWPTGLHHFAFYVRGEQDLDEARERLGGAGVTTVDVDVTGYPGLASAVQFRIPSGHLMRLVVASDPIVFQAVPTVDPAHTTGVGPTPLEHLSIQCSDVEETTRFLVDHLDFSITEVSRQRGEPWYCSFVRTRDLHHDLGVFRGEEARLDHFGFTVESVDSLVRFADLARGHGHMLACSPGRHIAGNNVFVYIRDPLGTLVEAATPMSAIDIAAEPRMHEADSMEEWRGIFDAWREGIPPESRTGSPLSSAAVEEESHAA